MKHFYALLLIAILLPSLAMAGGYESKITKIGDSQVPNGIMQLSADGKFIYVCNKSCNFVKFDIDQEAVTDTFAVSVKGVKNLETFIVDRSGKYLIQQISGILAGWDTINTYDLTTKKKIGEISNFYIKDIFGYDFNFSLTKSDSVIAYSINGYGMINNTSVTGGGLYFYNFLKDSVEKSSPNMNGAIRQFHYSNDYNRLFLNNYNFSSAHSLYVDYSNTSTGFSVYDNNLLVDRIHFEYKIKTEGGYVTSEVGEVMNSIAVDNTNDKIFCTFNENIFRVYSLKDSAFIYEENRSYEINNYLFPPSDYYYFAFSNKNGSIYVFHKQNHIPIDTIQISGNINNAYISKDSSCIYAMNASGEIFRIDYELLNNSKKVAFNPNTKQIQLGDTIHIYDLSIGNFDSRKWIVNGVEIIDTAKVLKYVPEAKGLYTVELERKYGDSTYRKTEIDLFRVFERTKAVFTYSEEDFKDSIGVNFVNTSKGEELKFKWYFGDGETSAEVNPYHYYTKKGLYNVQLLAYNDFFADTMSLAEPIEFGSNFLLNITSRSNRFDMTTITDQETLNSISKATIYGSNGFKKNDRFGFSIGVVIKDHGMAGPDVLDIITKKGFAYLGNINHNTATTTNELLKEEIEMPGYNRPSTDPISLQSYFLASNMLINTYYRTSNIYSQMVSTYDIDSKIILEIYKNSSNVGIKSFHSFITNNEILSIFHSNLISNSNLDSATMLININISTKQQDTSYLNKQFFYSIPDNDNGIISLIAKENTKYQVYSYTLLAGLVPQFSLSKLDTVLFADRNIENENYLFISRKIQGTDSLLNLTITNKNGNVISSDTLENIRKITDIKFTKDLILITPSGNPRLIIYDLNGNFISEYSDNYINGELNDITYLNNNKALLVGTKYSINSNIKGNIPSQSELYYVVDLGPTDSIIDQPPTPVAPSSISCYPNPANSDIRFDFANNENELARLTIIDPMGNEIANLQTIEDFATFPTERLAIGVYLVRGTIGSQTLTGKFVVAR